MGKVTPQRAIILEFLKENEDKALALNEVAAGLGMKPSNTHRHLQRLLDEKMIVARPIDTFPYKKKFFKVNRSFLPN